MAWLLSLFLSVLLLTKSVSSNDLLQLGARVGRGGSNNRNGGSSPGGGAGRRPVGEGALQVAFDPGAGVDDLGALGDGTGFAVWTHT